MTFKQAGCCSHAYDITFGEEERAIHQAAQKLTQRDLTEEELGELIDTLEEVDEMLDILFTKPQHSWAYHGLCWLLASLTELGEAYGYLEEDPLEDNSEASSYSTEPKAVNSEQVMLCKFARKIAYKLDRYLSYYFMFTKQPK